ncbi:MAG: hypothetical protein AUK48_01105 [Oscillatoriales cyanobacterium CG2_30_44_21]|nr:MAG: hypothetical protein AUK48_01105 [Oscillatoriales cyanobacterium CG2_30_44_21]
MVAYRGGKTDGGAADLRNFFKFFSEKNANHAKAVAELQTAIPPALLIDDGKDGAKDAEWIEKFRVKPPAPPVASILNVPFFSQVDNYTQGERTCNSSACAMCLEFLKPGTLIGATGDDAYLRKVLAIGDSTNHDVQTKVLSGYGISSSFSYRLSFADIDNSLAKGKPVVLGILHRGSDDAPSGGHMIVAIGKKGNDYVVNDPYGSFNDSYTGSAMNGRGAIYTRAMLELRWAPAGNDGWGRIFV